MRYWPLSIIRDSPLMAPAYAMELYGAMDAPYISQGALIACNEVSNHTRHIETSLVIVHGTDAPMRRVYIRYPEFDEWMRLERGGFIATDESFGFVVDALH